jgi:hypothetical protein
MIERCSKPGQLFAAITAFIFIAFEDSQPIFSDVVEVRFLIDIWRCNRGFECGHLNCGGARGDFLRKQDSIQRTVSIGFSGFNDCAFGLKGPLELRALFGWPNLQIGRSRI